jgi:hypothetical protein
MTVDPPVALDVFPYSVWALAVVRVQNLFSIGLTGHVWASACARRWVQFSRLGI